MAIHTGTGNICNTEAEALVCTVNCVGVMGKGVALAVKQAFPEVYEPYRKTCAVGLLNPGRVLVIERALSITPWQLLGPRRVFCFATKDHWRQPSKLEWIERGLVELVAEVRQLQIPSIAIPPLGCGNGGLDWKIVRPMIVAAFEPLSVDVYLYEPEAK